MWDVIVLIPALGFFYLFYYALTLTAVWLLPIYFDTYIGSSYMIQVLFCLYVYVEEQYSMAVVEFLLENTGTCKRK